jgi:hypothetical protein
MTFIIKPMNKSVHMACIIILLVFAIYVSVLFLFYRNCENETECMFHRLLGILILAIVAYVAAHRDTFLPFIGEAVFPYTLIKDATVPRGSVSKTIKVSAPYFYKIIILNYGPDENKLLFSDLLNEFPNLTVDNLYLFYHMNITEDLLRYPRKYKTTFRISQ